jgi:hypothetical protein
VVALSGYLRFSLQEKLVAPLIATPKWVISNEDKVTQKEKREGSEATGYKVIRLQQIGRSPILRITNYVRK